MGKILKFLNPIVLVKSLFDSGSKSKAQAPKAVDVKQPLEESEAFRDKTRTRRANLFATEGGAAGQDLNPEQIQRRPTLLGN